MKWDSLSLDASRQVGDATADHAIQFLVRNRSWLQTIHGLVTNSDLINLDLPEVLDQIRQEVVASEGADHRQIKIAQAFFQENKMTLLALLGLYALPYCYAAANGARVLIHSKRIIEEPQIRLAETAQFVLDVSETGAFDPQGRGLVSILKVRLMHAAIRYHATHHIKDEVPINQEDMAGTNLSFSLICLRGMQTLGYQIDSKTSVAFLNLWNHIGIKLGIDPAFLPKTLKDASRLEKAIRMHQFRTSKEGQVLIRSLVDHFDRLDQPMIGDTIEGLMRHLMGDKVANVLGLQQTGLTSNLSLTMLSTSTFFLSFVANHYGSFDKVLKSNLPHDPDSTFRIPL